MDLKKELACHYGHAMKLSELAVLLGFDLLELHKTIAQSKGKTFDNVAIQDLAIPTDQVAAQIIAQELILGSPSNRTKQTPEVVGRHTVMTI